MTYRFCKILNIEDDYKEIEQALEINNKIWNVKSTLREFENRADNGYLIALFEDNVLQGTISGLTLNKNDILNNSLYQTWDGVTSGGSFKNVNKNGDTLCCVAITSKGAIQNPQNVVRAIPCNCPQQHFGDFVNDNIQNYLDADLDPVINFHKKHKVIIDGAKVIKVLANGRPDDKDSLGFNVLMEYPRITDEIRDKLLGIDINCENMGIGKALILGALKEALRNENIKYIMPYSRPVKYGYYLRRAWDRFSDDSLGFESDNEKKFFESIERFPDAL